MLAINYLRFASLLMAMHVLGIESRSQNGRNLRLRYPYGSPPPRPPNAPPGKWVWVGPPQENSEPEVEVTPDPEPEPVANYEIESDVIDEIEQVAEDELTQTVSEPEESTVEYEEEEVIEEPAVEEYVINGGVKEEAAVEDTATTESNYNTQVTAGATLMAESVADDGNTGTAAGAIVSAAVAAAAVVALALVALGRRRKKNNREHDREHDREWENTEVEIGSDKGYEDNFVGDDDVPPPPPPLPVDANVLVDETQGYDADAWHRSNYVPDDPSQEGVEISDLVEL